MVRQTMLPLFATVALCSGFTADQAKAQSLVEIVDIVVDEVEYDDGELVAEADVTLKVAGRTVTRSVEIPVSLGGTAGPNAECGILNLVVGPLNLDLLGLVVELDDCEDGPVTVDVIALAGEGLLGDLLCDVATLLDSGLSLEDLLDLGLLSEDDLDDLTGAVREILNGVLGELVQNGNATSGSGSAAAARARNRCDILALAIPQGLTLEVLGLLVDTSGVCLDVYAQRGRGKLLGNLLCTVTNLLDGRGNRRAIQRLLNDIDDLLD